MAEKTQPKPRPRPLVNDQILREELARLETYGLDRNQLRDSDTQLPPTSATRIQGYPRLNAEELERLRQVVKQNGIELINDGACYRAKRQRDFMIWTLEVSPLVDEARGGGEGYALIEIVRRFCGKS